MNKEEFIKEVSKLGITLTNHQLEQLNKYYQQLVVESQKYNLTSITEEEDVYLKHFYDSITIFKACNLSNQTICDIGTGAGFPGLVLKIVFPNLKVTLVDATEKKCKFLKIVINELGLKDVEVINEREEIYSKIVREKYDIVTSRAVAPLKHLLEYSIPLVKVNGFYIAMKGDITKEIDNIEIYEKKLDIKKINEIRFNLPKENSLRTLIIYQKTKETDKKYPRRYNDIKKKEIK